MKYRNVFSVIKESDRAADFIYCIYVMFCEKKDEEVEKQIHEEVKRIWSENEPHLTVTNLMLLFEDDVLKKHIALFVNDFSLSLGKQGKTAIETLYQRAKAVGIINEVPEEMFIL